MQEYFQAKNCVWSHINGKACICTNELLRIGNQYCEWLIIQILDEMEQDQLITREGDVWVSNYVENNYE